MKIAKEAGMTKAGKSNKQTYRLLSVCFICVLSDQMGNKGAYIHLRGSDLKPEFHQFTAVVSKILLIFLFLFIFCLFVLYFFAVFHLSVCAKFPFICRSTISLNILGRQFNLLVI